MIEFLIGAALVYAWAGIGVGIQASAGGSSISVAAGKAAVWPAAIFTLVKRSF
jgi:hypothetical protein